MKAWQHYVHPLGEPEHEVVLHLFRPMVGDDTTGIRIFESPLYDPEFDTMMVGPANLSGFKKGTFDHLVPSSYVSE